MNGRSWLLLLAGLCLTAGVLLLTYSFSQLLKQDRSFNKALDTAHAIVEKQNVLQKEQTPSQVTYQQGDIIGLLQIPTLTAELPIIEGTNEDELEKGVGHYSKTALPGQTDQILLSGHRDTVFRRIGELQKGDHLSIKMRYGEFTYEIYDFYIVDADDTSVIRSTAPNEILTLSTCYPFSYIGNAPYRYVLSAKRIKKNQPH
ncbi:class D sortase [Cytobacillus spongiae]|jgi:sortase A|uniref:class D sortase n=1 Tax=Cytobacillus spongiae TaxID=2901381 RepID=UPI001F483A57|nr:class D sortase [Cytobacillus spongiae]UII56509.1 class D sortase [Cytobacillus spongiae]